MSTDRPSPVKVLPDRLKGKERERAIQDPGTPWKEWALYTGLKPWVALGLLIVDVWAVATLLEFAAPSAYSLWGALGVGPVILVLLVVIAALTFYLNFVLWSYLWAGPPGGNLRTRDFRPSPIRPFFLGRWTPDYQDWRSGALSRTPEDVPVEEFL